MKIAIMQPYVFPYIGYFQLIAAVDIFVFYDDVNFIKRGWINRNRILLNGKEKLVTFPCIEASQNKLINEVAVNLKEKQYGKLKMTIEQSYKKAPHFLSVFPLIEEVLNSEVNTIARLATKSVQLFANYIGIKTSFYESSEEFNETKGLEKADRLIAIAKKMNIKHYINAIGGKELYDKKYFKNQGVQLNFLKPGIEPYYQSNEKFVPGLSIIDVLMFNDKEKVKELLTNYTLV
ncbi:WbqC family protein [Sinomicrobium weinanense]|uniref:WbqC family protein n=1 Tax=Sinomicrobium weinanense TaxID=2842200 RepID=A0A926JVS6_9FLAO|nr:WbqC family protein [Sinomicrobium weinanense]MBC9798482.1 WbqC family protein [Sinomicrobium weinanense]MBU3123717.1 WbqC family protein [Sinomicrobium weinanense]